MNRKLASIVFSAVVIILSISCSNSILNDLTIALAHATTISAPVITGSSLTNDRTPSWSWTPVPDAEYYRYGFSEDNWLETAGTDLSYTESSNMAGGSYTFYVQAGKASDVWSESASFTTVIDLIPPDAPVVTGLSPTYDTTPEWSWFTDADAVRYRYGFSEGVWISENSTADSYTPVSSLSEGEHTLYVQARDAAGNWSSSGSFTITIDQYAAIDPPVTPSPASGSTIKTTTPLLDWEELAYAGGYQIQLNTQSDFAAPYTFVDDAGLNTSEYQVSDNLAAGETYYWRVRVKNTEGVWSAAWSDIWSFTITGYWAETLSTIDDEMFYSITGTSDGGLIGAGYSYPSGSDYDYLVVKMDAAGVIEWQKSYDYTPVDYAMFIQEAFDSGGSDGYIICGSTQPYYDHPWLVKLTSAGAVEWEYTYGSGFDEYFTAVKQTSDYGYIISGYTQNYGVDGRDYWILKLTSAGAISWQKTYGGSGSGWDRARSIMELDGGGYIVCGSAESFGAGGADFWILKLASDGSVVWENCYGGTGNDYAYAVRETSDGGYISVGSTESFDYGMMDIWVLKLTSAGAVSWVENIGGSYDDVAHDVTETADGDFIIAGYSDTHTDEFWDDFLVIKLSSTGSIIWQKSYTQDNGTGYQEQAYSVDITSGGEILVGGYSKNNTSSDLSAWLLRLNSDGSCSPIDSDRALSPSDNSASVTVTATECTVAVPDPIEAVATAISSSSADYSASLSIQAP